MFYWGEEREEREKGQSEALWKERKRERWVGVEERGREREEEKGKEEEMRKREEKRC